MVWKLKWKILDFPQQKTKIQKQVKEYITFNCEPMLKEIYNGYINKFECGFSKS
jgi:hypothetical protein